jgi:hypothetical protein
LLEEISLIAIATVVRRAESWNDMVEFGCALVTQP